MDEHVRLKPPDHRECPTCHAYMSVSVLKCWRCGMPTPWGKLDRIETARRLDQPRPDACPLPYYDCRCKGSWCRLLGRNLK